MIFQDVSGASQRPGEPLACGVGGGGDTPLEPGHRVQGRAWRAQAPLPARPPPAPLPSPHWKLTEDTGGGRAGL